MHQIQLNASEQQRKEGGNFCVMSQLSIFAVYFHVYSFYKLHYSFYTFLEFTKLHLNKVLRTY